MLRLNLSQCERSSEGIFRLSGDGQLLSVCEANRLEIHRAMVCTTRIQLMPKGREAQTLAKERCKQDFWLECLAFRWDSWGKSHPLLLMDFFCAQVTHLFDNGGTVFFAIFMAIWGKSIFSFALDF